ncbi:MAG: response regulator [Nitrospinaceae bacterium]|nr:response regulator [Nitrospinaceae bacterium]MBT4432617.1 response regulator [Nitrospinaceae bacterium]MBT5367064.1 response regulator [Nitrospinaceae bacterium]MBT5948881.1 response regulator [Nitrospinaceae bacterium]MBT6396397.1 response regulator [Nitrospinaceae bacterium]
MAHNLLLVDESPLIHRVVELTMEGLNISVFSAEDTEEAMTLARSLKPDFILASSTFKRNSGFDLCRALKDDDELGKIPVLMLSSAKENVTEQEALDVGAIGVLTKPFEPENLLAYVKEAISSAPSDEAALEPEVDEDIFDGDDAFADLEADPLIEDPLTSEPEDTLAADIENPLAGELENAAEEIGAVAEPSAFDEDDALSDLVVDDDDGIPPLDELDDTLEEAAPEAPPAPDATEDEDASADTAALEEVSVSGEDENIDAFLDEFGNDVEQSATEETPTEEASPSPGGEATPEEEDFDPMQLALEHTLADEFEALAEEETVTEEAPESVSSPEAGTSLDDEDFDKTLQEVEDSLAADLENMAEESTLTEEAPSGEMLADDLGIDELIVETPEESALEEAEAELGSLQAELAADFEAPDEIDEGGLEHLADDQVKAAEDELASLQEELAAEEDDEGAAISDYGTSATEAETFLEEMVFSEEGIVEESPAEAVAEAEAETTEAEFESALEEVASEVENEESAAAIEAVAEESVEEPAPTEDDLFWEQLEIEADDANAAPPESPEIYAIPHEALDADPPPEFVEDVEPLAMPQEPSGASEPEHLETNIEKSLERTVEAIVPALLRRIEDLVVAQIPDMVEKIVIREIDKIKRGE